MSGFYGVQTKVALGTDTTPALLVDAVSDGLRMHRSLFDANGTKGTLSRYANRVRPSLQPCAGQLVLYPTPVELVTLLPWILGGTPSGTSYPLGDGARPTFKYWAIRGSKIFKYDTTAVSRATFSGRQGEAVRLALDLVAVGQNNGTAAGSFPALSIDATTQPFMFHEVALSVAEQPYLCREFSLTIDHQIDTGRFYNSQTLQSLQSMGRLVTLSHDSPFGDSESLYALSQAGAEAQVNIVNGTVSLTFTMPKVQYEDDSPSAVDRSELMLPLTGIAGATAAANELATVLDSTV